MHGPPELLAVTATAAEHVALAVAVAIVIGMTVAWRRSTRREAADLATRFTTGLREQ
ncbi:MAG: hypothetical protein RJA49_2898, partial [Actinomycetota bacterium]